MKVEFNVVDDRTDMYLIPTSGREKMLLDLTFQGKTEIKARPATDGLNEGGTWILTI